MKKRLLAILCTVCVFAANFPILCGSTVSAADSLISHDYITSEKAGNIFSDTDIITFTQKIKNTASEKVYARCTWNITDEAGNSVWSKSATETLTAGQIKTRSVTIDNPHKFGIYTINVKEENYAASKPSVKYTDTYTEEFSVCISLDKNNIDKSFGYNQMMINTSNKQFCCDYTVAVPLMQNAGANWHRESIMWQGVEPSEKSTYINLTTYIDRIKKIQEGGVNTVCVLTGRNSLYDDGKCPSSDEAIKAYAAYCAHIAKNLKGIANHFEIWNEWNHSKFNPSGETPETYAKVLKAAYTAIKEENPEAVVIGCDTAGITPQAIYWIWRVLNALNGGTYMDAISVHCYDYTSDEAFPESQFISEAENLKSLLERYNYDIPIWLTETGFSTYVNEEEGFVPPCTKDVQLNSIVMLRAVSRAYDLFDNIIEYNLYDFGDYSQIEYSWGVLNCWKRGNTDKEEAQLLPSGAKPAYLGTAAMSYFVGGNTEYINTTKDDRKYAFEFYNRNLGKNVTLAINGGFNNTAKREFSLGAKSVDVYDKYGNLVNTLTSGTGIYQIDTSSEPTYLVYTAPKITVTKGEENITDISELSAGDSAVIKFNGFGTEKPTILVSQYKDGDLESIDTIEETGSSESATEITGNFTVADGVDQIKIMCWYMDSMMPAVTAYEIE